MELALESFLSDDTLGVHLLDEETQGLLVEVVHLRKKSKQVTDDCTQAEEAVKSRTENLSHLRNVLDHLQELANTLCHQVDAEATNSKTSNQEAASLQHRCIQLEKQILEVQEDTERLQYLKQVKQKELEELENQEQDDGELVSGLLDQVAGLNDEDLMLMKLAAKDGSELHSSLLALEAASIDASRLETALEASRHQEAAECTAQSSLAAAYCDAETRRDKLLHHWEQGLNRLQQKGQEHAALIQEILKVREDVRSGERRVQEGESLLQQITDSCSELQCRLDSTLQTSSSIYLQILETEQTKAEIAAQVAGLQTGIKKTSQAIVQLKVDIASSKDTKNEKQCQLKTLFSDIEKSEQRLLLNVELVETTEETAKGIDALIVVNEGVLRASVERRQRAALQLQQHQNHMTEMQQQEHQQKGEIAACRSHAQHQRADIKILIGKTDRLKELCHTQDGKIEALRTRIHDLTHDHNNNEEEQEQRQQLSGLLETHQTTEAHLKQLLHHIAALQSQLTTENVVVEAKERDLNRLQQELLTERMACDGANRECARLTAEHESAEVRVSLQKLQLVRRGVQLHTVGNEVMDLSSSRLQMEQLAEEQCATLRCHVIKHETQLRQVEVEQHDIAQQLHRVMAKVSHFKERYGSVREVLGCRTDDEETEVTVARALMQVEEEVEGLQEAGDMADMAVREAADDLTALSVLTEYARTEGCRMRQRLHQTISQGVEDEPRMKLDEETSALEQQKCLWEDKLEATNQALKSIRERQHEVELQVRAVEDLLSEKHLHVNSVERELTDQKIKMNHAKAAIDSLFRRTRNQTDLHADVELRVTQERLKLVNQHLGRLAAECTEVAPSIMLYCHQANIPPPKIAPQLTRNKAFGSRSSLGSLSSSRSSDSGAGDTRPRPKQRTQSAASHDSGSSSALGSPRDDGIAGTDEGKRRDKRAPGSGRYRAGRGLSESSQHRAENDCTGITVFEAALPHVGIRPEMFKGRAIRSRPAGH